MVRFKFIRLFDKTKFEDKPKHAKAVSRRIEEITSEAIENIVEWKTNHEIKYDLFRHLNETLPPDIELSATDKEILKLMLHPQNTFTITNNILASYQSDSALTYLVTGDGRSIINKGVGKSTYALWALMQIYQGDLQLVFNSIIHQSEDVIETLRTLAQYNMRVPLIVWDDAGVSLSSGNVIGGGQDRAAVFAISEQLQLIRTVTSGLLLTAPSNNSITPMIRDHIDITVTIYKNNPFDLLNRLKSNEIEIRDAILYHKHKPIYSRKPYITKLGTDRFCMFAPTLYKIYNAIRSEFNVHSAKKAEKKIKKEQRDMKEEIATL